ncbi:SGNH/GDSL hydrolase family protein [Lactococcus lactis]|uniref:SGNH/GDSL hydrolase family protein n=1 Tax=Lactococcus lactis TaxID=1358 RepID=UPI0021A8D633|nr:SGNH/GDSL hydrolase family protein [Lactococcus lactis]
MSDYSVTLSTTEPNNYVGLIKLRQEDVASQSIQATITANGQLFNFDSLSVFFNAVLPNGNVVRDKVTNVDYVNSKLNYIVADSFLQEVAQVTAWFSFENGDKIIDSTKNFQYSVIAGWKESIPQGNYIYELSEIQREIEEIIGNKDFSSLLNKIGLLETNISYLDNTKVDKDEMNVKIKLLNDLKADKTFVDAQFASIVSGSPKGTFATLTALQSAYPNGTEGVFLVLENGHWYYYASGWKDGGVYQGNGVSDNSVKFSSIDKKDFNVQFDPKLKVVYKPNLNSWINADNPGDNAKKIFMIPFSGAGKVTVSFYGSLFAGVKSQIKLVKRATNSSNYYVSLQEETINETKTDGYTTITFNYPVPEGEYFIAFCGINFRWGFGYSYWLESKPAYDESLFLQTKTDNRGIDAVISCDFSEDSGGEKFLDENIHFDLGIVSSHTEPILFIPNYELPIGTNSIIFGTNNNPPVFIFRKKGNNSFEKIKRIYTEEKGEGARYRKYFLDIVAENDMYVGVFGNVYYDTSSNVSGIKGHFEKDISASDSENIGSMYFNPNTNIHMVPILYYDENLINVAQINANSVEKINESLIDITNEINKIDIKTITLTNIIRKMKGGNAVTISLYGDSTYYGHKSGAVPLGTRTSEPVSESLQKYLRAYYLNENITVNNYATNGRQAQQDSDDWDTKMANDKADVIFINFGINDSNSGKTAETFYSQMETLVQGALKTNKAVILETANQVLTFDKGSQGMGNYTKAFNIKEFVDVTRQLVKDCNINLLDGYKRSLSYINEFFNPTIALPDGMHPSDDMYKYKAVQMMSMFTNTSFSKLKSGQTLSILEANFNTTTPNAVADSSSKFGFKYTVKDISVSFGLEKQSDIKIYIKSTSSMKVYVNGLDTSYISSDGYITIKDVHSNAVFIKINSNEQTDIYGLEVV